MVFADKDVGGSKVAVDVVLRLQILHTLTRANKRDDYSGAA